MPGLFYFTPDAHPQTDVDITVRQLCDSRRKAAPTAPQLTMRSPAGPHISLFARFVLK